MITKLAESVSALQQSFFLLTAIVLTVWLPGNLLINYLYYFGDEQLAESMSWRLPGLIDGVFGPIYTGGVLHTLVRQKMGQSTSYGEAMREGIANWGSLFAARFIAGVFILLGLIALIVPGIVLAVRWGMIDEAVVVEGKLSDTARPRSTQLTEGIRWELLGVWVLSLLGVAVASLVLYFPLGFLLGMLGAGNTSTMLGCTVIDCFIDVLAIVPTIVTFMYYWEQREREATVEDPSAAPTPHENGPEG